MIKHEMDLFELKAEIDKLTKRISILEAEKEQLEENQKLDSYLLNVLMDNISDAIYFKNERSEFIRISQALANRFGLDSSDQSIGKTDFDFFSQQHAQQAYDDEKQLMEKDSELVNIEEMETWPDRPEDWVSTTKMCLKDQNDRIIGTFGISRDITLRKKMEFALKASERKYKDLYDNAPVGYHEIDLEGNIIRVNLTEAKILGYDVDEMIGRSMMDFLPARFKKKARREIIKKITHKNSSRSTEWKYVCKNGREIHVSQMYRPCFNEQNEIIGGLVTIQDITEKKNALEKFRKTARELKKTAEQLKRSNADLEQFAYIASHDLQEPLRMVTSYLQLIAKKYHNQLDSQADDFISFAVDGARRMQVLINDLLIYSRVDTKGRKFVLSDFNKVIEIVKKNLKIAIEESGALIESDKLPVLSADQGQMVQLFQNLICNAIKFRGENPPYIKISSKKQDDNKWCFSVSDNGIGIDNAYADRIFMIFQRLHLRSEYPGTGIGLSVCKKIVERHEGKIWMVSGEDGGTTFHFCLPDKGLNKNKHSSG